MSVAEIIINDQFLVVIVLAILFSLLAIARRTVVMDALAWVCWFIVAGAHLMASPSSTPFYSFSFLFWGFGLIFFILMWADIWSVFQHLKSSKGVGPL